MNGIYGVAGIIIGLVLGWLLGVFGERKRRAPYIPIYLLQDVVSWICQGDRDRTMYAIVHKVYGGRKHLHDNISPEKNEGWRMGDKKRARYLSRLCKGGHQ